MRSFVNKLILASFLVNVGSTYGDSAPTVSLLKGQPAPFEGVLFNLEEANRVRGDLMDYARVTRLNALYEKDNKILETRVDNYSQALDKLSGRVIEADNRTWLYNAVYFGAGALTVILLAFATSKAMGTNP